MNCAIVMILAGTLAAPLRVAAALDSRPFLVPPFGRDSMPEKGSRRPTQIMSIAFGPSSL